MNGIEMHMGDWPLDEGGEGHCTLTGNQIENGGNIIAPSKSTHIFHRVECYCICGLSKKFK